MPVSRFSWLGFARVVPMTIGLISGGLGVAQQIVLLYTDNPSPIWQRQLFWSIVWIAFVLSAIVAWVIEHRKVRALEVEMEKSQFADFVPKILEPRVAVADWHGETNTIITLMAEVRNLGAASIVSDWKLRIRLATGDVAGDFVAAHVKSDGLFVLGEHQSLVYPMSDSLLLKGSSVIGTGDRIRGYLSFAVPIPIAEPNVPGVALCLYCTDVRDRSFLTVWDWDKERPRRSTDLRFYAGTNPAFVGGASTVTGSVAKKTQPKKRRRKKR